MHFIPPASVLRNLLHRWSLLPAVSGGVVLSACLAAGEGPTATAATAADERERLRPIAWQLFAGWKPAFKIEEARSDGRDFVWEGGHERAPLIGIQRLERIVDWPVSWGVELSGSWRDARPDSYRSGLVHYVNRDGEHLFWHSATLAALAVWHVWRPSGDDLSLVSDVQGYLGATAVVAMLENTFGSDRSYGYGADAGVRWTVGLYERQWSGSILLGWNFGYAQTEFSMGSYSADLVMMRTGAEAAAVMAYRW